MDTSAFINKVKKPTISEQLAGEYTSAVPDVEAALTSDISDAEGEVEEEYPCSQTRPEDMEPEVEVTTEEQHQCEDDHQPEEGDSCQSEDDTSPMSHLPPLPSPSNLGVLPKQPQTKKRSTDASGPATKKSKGVAMSLASVLFLILPIRLDNYGLAHQKYSKIVRTKANERLMTGLHQILHYWGSCISQTNNSIGSLQQWLKEDIESDLYMTVLPASLQKRLSDWLHEYNAQNRRYRNIQYRDIGTILIGYHETGTSLSNHLHVIHDCRWSGASCRCTSLASLPRSPGFRRRSKPWGQLQTSDFRNVAQYTAIR